MNQRLSLGKNKTRHPAVAVRVVRSAGVLLAIVYSSGDVHASSDAMETNLPPPAQSTIIFDRAVRPIFEQSCFRCHGPEKPKSEFHLDNRTAALRGGYNNTNDIVPGHSAQSQLIRYVAGLDEDIQMPPPRSTPALTPEQIGVLRAWIDQGALWGTNSAPPALAFSLTPQFGWIGVTGDARKFRELNGTHEGWSGGAQRFSLTNNHPGPDAKLTVAGHALWPDHDFKLTLAIEKNDLGFVRSGFEAWRKYYDDTAGFYPSFTRSPFSLDQDLHLDLGRVWVDWGLTRPGWPEILVGYEYQYRQGTKSMLAWGTVIQGGNAKNIYPNAETINEHTHILKLNLADNWLGWELEDQLRVEFYRLSESRNDVLSYTSGPTPDLAERVNQKVRHTRGVNTFRVVKQLTDWWRFSAGTMYSHLGGTSLFDQSAVTGSGMPTFGQRWKSQGITLERDTHIASLSSLFLPLKGLSLSAAGQAEWTREKGFGNVNLDFGDPTVAGAFFPFPGTVDANLDRTRTIESLEARFTRLPHTVLFAKGRLQQESVGQFDQADNAFEPVEQRTDALNHHLDARAGFTSSPRSWLEYGAHLRRRDSSTGYNHRVAQPGNGYPGFITHRDIRTDEIAGRLVLRPVLWLNARLTYRWSTSGYSSATERVDNGATSPGGPILDGRTVSDDFGLSLNLTPSQRFYCSGSFTYGYSSTTTRDASPEVQPYLGNTYTVGANAGYVVNARTKLQAAYTFSKATYGQNNTAGIPLGFDLTRHEVFAGLTRQLTKNTSGNLRYEFSQYAEPSSGGANDFTAHGLFASLTYRWP